MRIALTAAFVRAVEKLPQSERDAVADVVRALPQAFQSAHTHAGIGLRKIHPSGIWEARIGLGLRIAIGVRGDTATLARIGTHDEIRRYLRTL